MESSGRDTYTWYGEKLPAKKNAKEILCKIVSSCKNDFLSLKIAMAKCPTRVPEDTKRDITCPKCPARVPGIETENGSLLSLVIPFGVGF